MAQAITPSRHRRLHWLRGGLGAAAIMALASCTGMDDPGATGAAEPGAAMDPTHGQEGEAATGPQESGVAAGARAAKSPPYAPDELLIRFKSGTGIATTFAAHDEHQARLLRAYRLPSNLHLVALPAGKSVEQALERYRRDPNVLYAEPNYLYQLTTVPNDPRYPELWGMDNAGQTGGTLDADINAPEAWDITTGSPDLVIGVLDTGIDYNHEDLSTNVWVNPGEIAGNGVDDDGNGYIDDIHGINGVTGTGDPMDDLDHGTHVSGTIAGRGDNQIGVTGVSWSASVVGCKAFSSTGGSLDAILACMDYFLELKTRTENPVNIIATNNSWGGGPFSQALYDAVEAHRQAGILFIAAAGNDFGNDNDANPFYPATYDLDNIISVLATDHDDRIANFSNLGARSVDVGAPGQDVLSSLPGNRYGTFSGTSMATPHVTGLAGLLKAQDPSRSPQAIKNLILTGGTATAATAANTLSGRRIRADSSLTCTDRVLTNRFAPAGNSQVVAVGEEVALGVLSINCEAPNDDPQTVTVSPGGERIELVDAGGTGQFEGTFTPPALGAYRLAFSNGDTVTVAAIGNYDVPRPAPFACREFTGTALPLGDDSSTPLTSPFPIPFAGATAGMETLHVSSNGTINFSSPFVGFSNQPLPTGTIDALIAPLWDDLNPSAGGAVSYDVLGEAPRRELVVEWRDVPHFPNVGAATFQVVFFEGSPNVLFNYCDVTFGQSAVDRGADATIGIQVTGQVAQMHSFNQASVTDGSALLFSMGAPMAVAGRDQVVLPGADVTLDGSASQDFDGTITDYAWTQVAGEPVRLRDADAPVVTFTALDTPGTLTFQLEVTDDAGQTGAATVEVIVNQRPVADAGRDYAIGNHLSGTLDASASYDPDGMIAGYRWTQLHGVPVRLTNGDTAAATFTAPVDPQYMVFQLTVTDEHGFTHSDIIVVEVFHNDPPLANAGADRVVRPGATIRLDASASMDPDGTLMSYAWEVSLCVTLDGPCELPVRAADTMTPQLDAPAVPSLVHILLTVTDDAGALATDTIVLGVFLQAPTAAPSAGEGCTRGGATVTLDATASYDPDGSIVRYGWVQVGGPTVTLRDADTARAVFSAPAVAGNLIFELTVTDDDDLTSTRRLTLPIDMPPVAAASADALAALTGATVTLGASESEDAAIYQWTQTAGPTVRLSDPAAASPTFVAPAPGSAYEPVTFELTVTNTCGSAATDTVSVVIVRR